ncbi:MAG TPA: ornithine carbamoyltransferase [Anaerolineae bacterium]|nr:ornithine carbamoyltransferase [Anaerolineae bacterium]
MRERLRGRHLIALDEWTTDEIDAMIDVSSELKRLRAMGQSTDLLKNKTLFMIFFEQSTRTRNSMEAAMTQLGGHAHDLTPDKMQLSHGETPRDTAKVLSRMGEAIAIRNCLYGTGNLYLNEIAAHADIPLISMQDDVYHPLQAAADLMTMQEHFGANLRGLRVVISWAYATSHAKPLSVPQSQVLLFPRYGVDVVVAHPVGFPLQDPIVARAQQRAEEGGGSLTFVHDMDEAMRSADIIFPKNWGGFAYLEPYEDTEASRVAMRENLERNKDWILDRQRYSLAKRDTKVMHALPADRNNEITDEILDGPNSIIYDEAENRLHTAKAILTLLIGGAG